jgi:hypothetical protein
MVTAQKTTAEQIIDAVKAVTKDWCRQRKAEERHAASARNRRDNLTKQRKVSIKDAAWSVMTAAYTKASGNGKYPANARQIMYAARPKILELTGKDELNDAYFTQQLLPDFMSEHPETCANWDVAFDARGNFTEPHTGRSIGLGTIEVRRYVGDRPWVGPAVSLSQREEFPTTGPENRFRTIIFVEKEGFDPLFEAAKIRERFDAAAMSPKGVPTTSARHLVDELAARGVQKILVLHDFDVSGFTIFGTLGSDNRRYRYANKAAPIVDIGLRLTDVEEMGLESEPVSISGEWTARAETLARHGATPDEIEFLRYRRVELNAMTSEQMVVFIEAKFSEHGVTKVIPDADTIERHARRLIEQRLADEAIEKMLTQIAERAATATLPADLRVEAELTRRPKMSWDAAVSNALHDPDLGEIERDDD